MEKLNATQTKVLKALSTNTEKWFTFEEINKIGGINNMPNTQKAVAQLQNKDYLFVSFDNITDKYLVQISLDGESLAY